ncbi:MAG TPA: hypothetical protein VHQ39_07410 [Dongiaceae bacterium]|jgi:hypothetical protein|nr:hypothetical protein [Dongiaceae bacterium]
MNFAAAPDRHLDFWLGHWECRWEGGQGTNRIEKILHDRVIQEQFDGNPGMNLLGRSWSVYDPAMGKWRQTWVDNEGTYLDLVGGKEADRFVLLLVRLAEETPFKRMIFQNISREAFDWHWQASTDRGASWSDSWYIRYRRLAG